MTETIIEPTDCARQYLYGLANGTALILCELKDISSIEELKAFLAEKEKEMDNFEEAIQCEKFVLTDGCLFNPNKTLIYNRGK